MKQTNDGGPAYPTLTADVVNMHGAEAVMHYTDPDRPGMSLRDWFAGQALANPKICGDGSAWEVDARAAYAAADAMLAERDKEVTHD